MAAKPIPPRVIALLAPIISRWHTHATMDAVFAAAECTGEIPQGTKTQRATQWMRQANKSPEPLAVLGCVLGEMMDRAQGSTDPSVGNDFNAIMRALEAHGLRYQRGGSILTTGLTGPSQSLEQDIKARGIPAIEEEFQRVAYATVETDPPAAVTAACAIVESVCKTYLGSVGERLPSKQAIDPLWTATAKHLGLDPATLADNDLKKILSGLFSVAHGVGGLRTHEGSAHGRSGVSKEGGKRSSEPAPCAPSFTRLTPWRCSSWKPGMRGSKQPGRKWRKRYGIFWPPRRGGAETAGQGLLPKNAYHLPDFGRTPHFQSDCQGGDEVPIPPDSVCRSRRRRGNHHSLAS